MFFFFFFSLFFIYLFFLILSAWPPQPPIVLTLGAILSLCEAPQWLCGSVNLQSPAPLSTCLLLAPVSILGEIVIKKKKNSTLCILYRIDEPLSSDQLQKTLCIFLLIFPPTLPSSLLLSADRRELSHRRAHAD